MSTARDLDFEGIFSDMVSGLLGSGAAAAVHQAPGAPSQVYLLRSMINPNVSNGPYHCICLKNQASSGYESLFGSQNWRVVSHTTTVLVVSL